MMNNWLGRFAPLWNVASEGAPGVAGQSGEEPASLLGGTGDGELPDPVSPPPGGEEPPTTPPGEKDEPADADAEGGGAEEVLPLTADAIALPEGIELGEGVMDSFLAVMNDVNLEPAARAQALIDLQVDYATKANEATQEAYNTLWQDTQKGWQDEVRADPTIGGAKLDQSLSTIKRGLESVGATPATFAALDLTGAGNHPEIIRVLHALTLPLAERAPPAGSPPRGALSQADRLFPSMAKE